MRGFIKLLVIAVSVAFAVVAANKLAPESLAVIVGVVLGVLAAIPLGAIAILIMKKYAEAGSKSSGGGNGYPPVIIISADGVRQQRSQLEPPAGPGVVDGMYRDAGTSLDISRAFRVIGDDGED